MNDLSNLKRVEGVNKLTGKSKFIDDIKFPNMLFGATLRSKVARGIIKEIKFDKAINWDEFVIVTADDIPGSNVITVIEDDWPFLADGEINHRYEAILLLAHPDKLEVERAVNHIEVIVEELPGVFNIDDSLNQKEVVWGNDNVQSILNISKGNTKPVFDNAYKVIEGVYETGAQEQLYIENNGMIANFHEHSGVTIWGSMQCPYYVHGAIGPLFDFPKEKVRIIQVETGGGFGGKEDYPSMIAGHAALLAYKAKKPVKLCYYRDEDLGATTKRHPSKTIHKTAVDKNGKLLAMEIDFLLDGGAYATLSKVVLSRGMIHSAGPYECDNIEINAKSLATNHPPNGAYRGFGAPQSIFAVERHMDEIARVLNLDPIEFRRRNFIKVGGTTATGQVIKERIDFDTLVNKAKEVSNYDVLKEKFEKENKLSPIKKGLGISCFMHGAGFTGGGENYLSSVVGLKGTPEGKIRLLCSSTEMGQGKNTIMTQVLCETLNVFPDDILIPFPDTYEAPDTGPTVASRTVMIVGGLVEKAALGLKETLIQSGLLSESYSRDEFINALKKYYELFGTLTSFNQYKPPRGIQWDDETYKGDAYPTYAWAVYLAEVSVDTRTYESKVDNFYAIQEVGRVMNQTLAEGQIEGGIAQAIGYAIYEKVEFQNGGMANNQMTNYIMPTSMDLPNIKVYFEEWNKDYGPGGAKGIGELPMDGPAPAIINGMNDALATNIAFIPFLPEDLLDTLEGKS